jgi:hypothetical protein
MKFEEVKEGMILGEEGVEEMAVLIVQKSKDRIAMISLDGEDFGGSKKDDWDNSPWVEVEPLEGAEPIAIKSCFENEGFRQFLQEYWKL